MAPILSSRRADKLTENLLIMKSYMTFGEEISNTLTSPNAAASLPAGFAAKLTAKIETFPKSMTMIAGQLYSELDRIGTSLWNLCTRLRRSFDVSDISPKSASTAILLARVFALLLLDYAQTSNKGTPENVMRLMKVALKTIRNCIDLKQYGIASKALERAGAYEEYILNPNTSRLPHDDKANARMSAEYFTLRAVLAWKQGNIDAAEHLFNKTVPTIESLDPATAGNMADALFEMGMEQLKLKQYELAIKWLDRALNILMTHEVEELSADHTELRHSILQSSVDALLKIHSHDAIEQAQRLIEILENEVGDRLVVLLLKLEMLDSGNNEVFDGEAYTTILRTMVHTVVFNENTFKTLMHHVRKLNDKSPSLACKILDELVAARLLDEESKDRLETVVVNRLWMTTNQKDGSELLLAIEEMLTTLKRTASGGLSADGSHASQILLWKRVELNYSTGDYEAAERWCRLALHDIFKLGTGELNKTKISRKLLSCALARLDLVNVHEAIDVMTEAGKNETMTQFLMFKLAIRTDNVDLARIYLTKVNEATDDDPALLYACVLDAQQSAKKGLAVLALQMVLDRYNPQASSGVHLLALLRCTIRMMISILDSNEIFPYSDSHTAVDQICLIFETASVQAQKSLDANDVGRLLCSNHELEWFSKNSYNLALKYSTTWHPLQVYRLLCTSIKFLALFPTNLDSRNLSDILLRQVFSEYLASIVLATLARAEDNVETRLQYYLNLRKHVASYDETVNNMSAGWEGPIADDLAKKFCGLLALDFEAAVRLKAWDDLGSICLRAESCKSMWIFEIFADCLLAGEVPPNVIIARLKAIVNSAWALGDLDTPKLSRYMRLLFKVSFTQGEASAIEILVLIEKFARDAMGSDRPYPEEELDWISTVAFNHAVDFFCVGEDNKCRDWAGRAINLSGCLTDGGALQAVLQEKLVGLSLG